MTDNVVMAGILAEKLVGAYALVVTSGAIVRASEEQGPLRDYLTDADDDLEDVITALVGSVFARVQ